MLKSQSGSPRHLSTARLGDRTRVRRVAVAQAHQSSSMAPAQPQPDTRSVANDVNASTSGQAAQHSIIFVGGHQGDARRVANPQRPPEPCRATHAGSQSVSSDCSLNPQPIPPGHAAGHKKTHRDLESLYTPTTPRRHRLAVPHHGQCTTAWRSIALSRSNVSESRSTAYSSTKASITVRPARKTRRNDMFL